MALAAIGEDTPAVRATLMIMLTNYNLPFVKVAEWRLKPPDKETLDALFLMHPASVTRFLPVFRRMGSAARPIAPLLRD